MAESRQCEVLIVGAGPAGLSAALILGRCCRTVLICDRGTSRNWASKAIHGFLTRDGISPPEFTEVAQRQLEHYHNVRYEPVEVRHVTVESDGFLVQVGDEPVRARKLLIATGLVDQLPQIPGVAELFGSSVFQCPYCDGWEFRGRPVAVYGRRARAFEMARAMTAWTRDIVLCTDGPSGFTVEQRNQLSANDIQVVEQRVNRLVADGEQLREIEFVDGLRVRREALLFDTPSSAQSDLTEQLGCRINRRGGVQCGEYEATSVPGVYVAGNIIRNVQLSIVAAAEGANAAFGINRALTREDFQRSIGAQRKPGS